MAQFKRSAATAQDQEPVSAEKIGKILEFLRDRLTPADFQAIEDMVDDVIDEAEDLNPSREMAKDSLASPVRRAVRRALRQSRAALVRDTRMSFDAAAGTGLRQRYPEAARIGLDAAPPPRRPRLEPGTLAGFTERFGTARIKTEN